MFTETEQNVVRWLRQKKVATMRDLRRHFQVSHMTVVRALKKHGYFSSYNQNGMYYVLHDVPRFDDWGLWSWRNSHFSNAGTLKDTVLRLVEQSPAGRTTSELATRLLVDVAHLLSGLVRQQRLTQRVIAGRHVVYLASDPERAREQWVQRQQLPVALGPPKSRVGLPAGVEAAQVIQILRQMIVAPNGRPDLWTRQLKSRGVSVAEADVRRVIAHYALEKKRLT
jgi:hypothetical protein